MRPSAHTRALIGGRWAISVQGWLVTLAVAEVAALTVRTSVGPAQKLGLMLLAMLAAALVLLAANSTLFRHRATHPVPLWWVMALGSLAWLTTLPFRFVAGYSAFGAAPGEPAGAGGIAAMVVLLAIQGAIGWPAVSLGLASHDEYRKRRAALVAKAVQQEAARLRDIGAITALRTAAMEDLGRDIGPSVERATVAASAVAHDAPGTDLKALADMLTETASGVVRPSSHALWRSADAHIPRVRPRRVLASALRREPLPTAPVLIAFGVIILTGALARVGWAFLPAAIACLVLPGLVYLAGRRAIRARPAHSVAIGAATIAVAGIGVAVMPLLLLNPPAVRVGALLGVTFLACALAASVAVTALRAGEDVIDELSDLVDERAVEQAALRREAVALERELATHLHGTVQARLVAAAYALREADRTGDQQAARNAAEAAQSALAEAMATPVAPLPTGTPADLRAELTAQWGDVLALTWSEPPGPLSPHEARSVAEVLTHAFKNAVVHGGATAADISIVRRPEGLRIEVTDDGVGPGDGAPGMGSAYLDEVAAEWSLTPTAGGGSVLRAWLVAPAPRRDTLRNS